MKTKMKVKPQEQHQQQSRACKLSGRPSVALQTFAMPTSGYFLCGRKEGAKLLGRKFGHVFWSGKGITLIRDRVTRYENRPI